MVSSWHYIIAYSYLIIQFRVQYPHPWTSGLQNMGESVNRTSVLQYMSATVYCIHSSYTDIRSFDAFPSYSDCPELQSLVRDMIQWWQICTKEHPHIHTQDAIPRNSYPFCSYFKFFFVHLLLLCVASSWYWQCEFIRISLEQRRFCIRHIHSERELIANPGIASSIQNNIPFTFSYIFFFILFMF